MTYGALQSMRDDPQILANRLAEYLRPVPAKKLARAVGCDVRTAENIRRGHWPIARHWSGLIRAFGEDLTEAVFHPEKAIARLEREVADLEEQLAAKRAALADSDPSCTSQAWPRHESRAAALRGLRAPNPD